MKNLQLTPPSSPYKSVQCYDPRCSIRRWLCTHCTHTVRRPAPLQSLSDCCKPATRFGFTVSLKKTEVMLQPVVSATCIARTIQAGENPLSVTKKFCILGSMLSCDMNIDADINSRVAKVFWLTLQTSLGWPRHTSRDKNHNLQSSRTHRFTQWSRDMGTIQASHKETRTVPHAMLKKNSTRKVAG